MGDGVVKIDSELLKRVEEFIKKNKIRYSNKKQFVDIAVLEKLEKSSLFSKKRQKLTYKKGEINVKTSR